LPDLNTDYVRLQAKFTEVDNALIDSKDDYLGKLDEEILLKDIPNGKDNYRRYFLQDVPGSDMRVFFFVWRVY